MVGYAAAFLVVTALAARPLVGVFDRYGDGLLDVAFAATAGFFSAFVLAISVCILWVGVVLDYFVVFNKIDQ